MIKARKITLKILCSIMLISLLFGVVSLIPKQNALANTNLSYVELYSPTTEVDIKTTDATKFFPSIKDNQNTQSGKGLSLKYTVSESAVRVTIPIMIETKADDFSGLAMWVDIPKTLDEYSFSLRISNSPNTEQLLRGDKKLTLIDKNGVVTNQASVEKRLYLNGFTGWLMIPQSAYFDPVPMVGYEYQVIFLMETDAEQNAKRTQNLEITLGSFGYYTDYYSFILDVGGEFALSNKVIDEIDAYITDIQALETTDNKQALRKTSVINELNELKDGYLLQSVEKRLEIASELSDKYVALREEILYGDVMDTKYVMSFAIMSDTHFSNTWVNSYFVNALEDAKNLNPDLVSAFVLGDLSDQGVSKVDPAYSDLDNYYDWRDSYSYKNSKGEDIPITNILGNHDVRGSNGASDGRTKASYEAAVEMYLEREGVETLQWDKWINGYHFIFLNTDAYHKDNCLLSNETLNWLDEKLSENEDGRPIFVMVHQPLVRIEKIESTGPTFAEIIARHPSAIISSGHTHAAFGSAGIIQDGEGTYINQPSMKKQEVQYYVVDVYEGGAVFKARELGTNSWIYDSYVIIRDENKLSQVPDSPELPDNPENPELPDNPDNPETPDDNVGCNSSIGGSMMFVSFAFIIASYCCLKKKKSK